MPTFVGCSGSEPSQEPETKAPTQPDTTQQVEEAEPPTDRPNIIFVLTDDLDYAPAYKMPTLRSSSVDEGTSFENAFVSHLVCCLSRTTILTGLYDHNRDVRTNNPPDGGFEKFLAQGYEENTIAFRLQEGRYQTAFFGKHLNGYPGDDPAQVPPGWDGWYAKEGRQRLYDYQVNENGEVISYGNETEDFYTDVLSGQATGFVERAASEEKPLFMYGAPTALHAPATPAKHHEGAFADENPPARRPSTMRTSRTSPPLYRTPTVSPKGRPPGSATTTGSAWSQCWPSTRWSPRSSRNSRPRASSTTPLSSSPPTTATSRASTA